MQGNAAGFRWKNPGAVLQGVCVFAMNHAAGDIDPVQRILVGVPKRAFAN
jgi:hypothetical protein